MTCSKLRAFIKIKINTETLSLALNTRRGVRVGASIDAFTDAIELCQIKISSVTLLKNV